VAVLLGAVTALTLVGAPGQVEFRDIAGTGGGPRPFSAAFTRLGTGGTPARLYGNLQKSQAPPEARPYTTAFTRLVPSSTPSRVYGSFAGKTSTNINDFVVSDTIRVYVNEGPFSNLDLDVTEILAPRVADSLTGVNQGRSGSDIIRPRVTDTVQFLQKSGTLPKVGSDGIRVYVAETATTNVSITGTDAIVPVVADAVTGVEKPAAVIVSDTITVVLSDLSFADAANSGRDFAGTDPILPVLGESVTVAISGEVDKIVFTAEPFGSIRITEI
jgi:hypothetical protein